MDRTRQQYNYPGVLNPYTARAEDIEKLLTPPKWKPGDPPVNPTLAVELYLAARSNAIATRTMIERESEIGLTAEEQVKWTVQEDQDKFVLRERVMIYADYMYKHRGFDRQPLTDNVIPSLSSAQEAQNIGTRAVVPGFAQPWDVSAQGFPSQPMHLEPRREFAGQISISQSEPMPVVQTASHTVPQQIANVNESYVPMNVTIPVRPSDPQLWQVPSTAAPIGSQPAIDMNHPYVQNAMQRMKYLYPSFEITTPDSFASRTEQPKKRPRHPKTWYHERKQAVEGLAPPIHRTRVSDQVTGNAFGTGGSVDLGGIGTRVVNEPAAPPSLPGQGNFDSNQSTSSIHRHKGTSQSRIFTFSKAESEKILAGGIPEPDDSEIYYKDPSTGELKFVNRSAQVTNPEPSLGLMKSEPGAYQTPYASMSQTGVVEKTATELPMDHSNMASNTLSRPAGNIIIDIASSPPNCDSPEEPVDEDRIATSVRGTKRGPSPSSGSTSKRLRATSKKESK